MNIFCVLWLLINGTLIVNAFVPQVTIPDGLIQGYYDKTALGKTFAAFEGVPYGKPPVGKYRFRESQLPKPWKGSWVANHTIRCIQYDHNVEVSQNRIIGQEDCLYLNVYSPQVNQNALLDVIVHIHGGAFMFNAGHLYGPRFLMNTNVVFVTINYRLGPFGFLSTEDDVVPGNNGLKDQVLALKWIQNNIQYFGGNPNSVLITGLSAGGASVTYHYLSPLSKGLFHKGIALSGVAINAWAETENSLEKARKLAASIGCAIPRVDEMVNCMRNRPATQILSKVAILQPFLYNPFSPFGPVVEKNTLNPFLSESAYKLLHKSTVTDAPLIISIVKDEGLYPGAEFQADPSYLPEIDRRWEELAPHILDFNYTTPQTEHRNIAQQVKKHYLQEKPISHATYKDFIKMIGDRLFIHTIEIAGKLFTKSMSSSVYMLYFTYRGKYSKSSRLSNKMDDFGVCHADDLNYIVDAPWANPLDNSNDTLMVNVMMEMWSSFAKTGVPQITGVDFKPLQKSKGPIDYLHMKSPTEMKMESADTISERHFWTSLPINENKIEVQVKEEL